MSRMEIAMKLATEFVHTQKSANGVAVALVHNGEVHVEGIGKRDDQGRHITPDTQFQIGSITKAITGLLVAQREVDHPGFIDSKVREHINWPIHEDTTIRHLCTHTSGLPRMALGRWNTLRLSLSTIVLAIQGVLAKVVGQRLACWLPGGGYIKRFYESVDDAVLEAMVRSSNAKPGSGMSYSNMGAGVVGRVLGDYPSLVQSLFDGVGMRDSGLNLATTEPAQGYLANGIPVPFWKFNGSIVAAGGIYSTANDMAKLCRALLADGEVASWFSAARKPLEGDRGMFWKDEDGMTGHSGQTLGFHAFMGVQELSAVVVLANQAVMEVDALGKGMLDVLVKGSTTRYPLEVVTKISCVGRAQCDAFFGTYDMHSIMPGAELKVDYSRLWRTLSIRVTGQPWLAFYAVDGKPPGVFYNKTAGARLDFSDREVKLTQGGGAYVLKKKEGDNSKIKTT